MLHNRRVLRRWIGACVAGLALSTIAGGWAWSAAVIFILICVAGAVLLEFDDSDGGMTAVPVEVHEGMDPEVDRPDQLPPCPPS